MLSEAHKARMSQRYGIPPEATQKLQEQDILASVDRDEAARLLGLPPDQLESGGILIRYPNAPDDVFTIRLDVPLRKPDGKERKYLRPAGQGNRLFIPPGVDITTSEEIWITEGEMKALAASTRGLPCAALSGVWNWRTDTSAEDPAAAAAKLAGGGKTGAIPDEQALIEDLRRGDWVGKKRFVLLYDSDITQEHPAWPAFCRLAEQLYAQGAVQVKIITLPALGEGKTGLDDYIRLRESESADPAAELRAMIRQAPEWLPTGAGAKNYANSRLVSSDLEEVARGAAALLAVTNSEPVVLEGLRDAGVKYEYRRGLLKRAKEILQKAVKKQEGRYQHQQEKETPGKRTIVSRFPAAAEVVPEDFPFPPPPQRGIGKGARWDIRGGQVVLIHEEEGEETNTVATDTVILLTRRLTPVERDTGIEKWEVAWWEDAWQKTHLPADYLFDASQKRWLIQRGIPVSSENADLAVKWFHALRCEAVLRGASLPTAWTVSRCGWHQKNNKYFFVTGKEILTPDATIPAEAGDRVEIQENENADVDIIWAEDLTENERQILEPIRCGGDPLKHKRFLVETAAKYPQVAFGLGCAAGAPLIRFAQAAGLSDVAGFTVTMIPVVAGRSRHQGKTVWNQIIASLYGWPEAGETGRLRFADRTRVAMAVLFATCSDLTVHMEEVHKLGKYSKKNVAEEIDYLIHLAAAGMDRERGARGGGGRRTKGFKVVAFWTSEMDITTLLPAGSGAHDRIMKLPPLLPEESDENREEAERLSRTAMEHYGHAGREYITYLLRRLEAEGEGFITQEVADAIEILRQNLPVDSRRASAGRLAKRAGIGLAGLTLLLDALGTEEADARACAESFLQGWEMVMENIPHEDVADIAWQAVKSYIAANTERIKGLRETEKPPAPAEWVGIATSIKVDQSEVNVIAITESAFAEAVSRSPFGLDPEHAKRALAEAGKLLTRIERKKDGRIKKNLTVPVRLGEARPRMLTFPVEFLRDDDDLEGQQEETPF